MSREISFSRVSTKLAQLYSQHKADNTANLWMTVFNNILNQAEAKRLFDLFAGDLQLLTARTKTKMAWSEAANPDNWTKEWCENVFTEHSITTKRGPTLGPDGKMLHPRPIKPKEKPIRVAPARKKFVRPEKLTLEELKSAVVEYQAVIDQREEEIKKQEEAARRYKHGIGILATLKEMVEGEGEEWEYILSLDKIV